MSHDDDALGTALWLAAGGAAGYAAGRWLVAPAISKQSPTPPTSSSGAPPTSSSGAPPAPVASVVTGPLRPRALASGPSGAAMPIDPYGPPDRSSIPALGPSGDMQPIDPYAVVVPQTTLPSVASSPAASTPSHPISVTPLDGPITKPSQVDVSSPPGNAPTVRPSQPAEPEFPPMVVTPARFATSARVRRFDPVFNRYRGIIPIEYVRALVERESDGQPSVRAGSAIGLMQIVPVVLTDYNKRHGTAYTSDHLADPAINVAIGCELLRIIAVSYIKNHPRIRTLQPDWDNPDYVALLTLGWNAGYSEAGGLGRVARYLEGLGAVDITTDQVAAHASLAGATKYLSNPAKVAWCKSVVALYQRERALRPSSPMV